MHQSIARLERNAATGDLDAMRRLQDALRRSGWTHDGRDLSYWAAMVEALAEADPRGRLRRGLGELNALVEALGALGLAGLPLLLDALESGAKVPLLDLISRLIESGFLMSWRSGSSAHALDPLRRVIEPFAANPLDELRQRALWLLIKLAASDEERTRWGERALSDRAGGVRSRALAALTQGQELASAAPWLVRGLEDPDPQVRGDSAVILAHNPLPPATLGGLLERALAGDEDTAITSLGAGANAAEAARYLAGILRAEETRRRIGAARALVHFGWVAEVAEGLALGLRDADPRVREQAAAACRTGARWLPDAPQLLAAQARSDRHAPARARAAATLATVGEADLAVPALIDALRDDTREVALAAIDSLRQRGEAAQAALPALVDLACSPPGRDEQVGEALEGALEEIGAPPDQAVRVARLLDSQRMRMVALHLLEGLGLEAAAAGPALERALATETRLDVRRELAFALLRIGEGLEQALPRLLPLDGQMRPADPIPAPTPAQLAQILRPAVQANASTLERVEALRPRYEGAGLAALEELLQLLRAPQP